MLRNHIKKLTVWKAIVTIHKKSLYVSTACLRLVANTYRNRFFSKAKILEDDILINICVIVDQVINAYNLQAKR